MGHVTDLGDGRIRAPKDLIQRLEARRHRTCRQGARRRTRTGSGGPPFPATHVSGQLVGSTQLSSGRFAMID